MKIYMVENFRGHQRTIAAVFAQKEDAVEFVESLANPDEWDVVERTLWQGQPPNRGYND